VTAGERARIIKTAVLATRAHKEHHAGDPGRRATWAAQAAAHGITPGSLLDAVAPASAASPEASPSATLPVGARRESLTRDGLLAEAVTTLGRSKAVWSRADLLVAIAARVDLLDEPTPPTAADAVALVSDLAEAAARGRPRGQGLAREPRSRPEGKDRGRPAGPRPGR